MSAFGGEFNRSTQHLLILPDEEVCVWRGTAELWDRWRNGQCIADIARALERNGARARDCMAEREGFEPPVPRRAQQISSLPRSTTPASLRGPNEPRILSGARDPLLPVHVPAQGARHANSPVGGLADLDYRGPGAP